MNSRERFLAAMQFKAPDKLPLPSLFQTFGAETIRRWKREGLPHDDHHVRSFGFDRCELAPIDFGLLPAGALAEASEAHEWEMGDRNHEEEAIARGDELKAAFPLRSADTWVDFKRRLNPDSPARYPRFYSDWAAYRVERDYPLGLALNGPFSSLIEWMGPKALGDAFQTERGRIDEMVGYLGSFITETAKRAVETIRPDFVIVRERWAYRAPQVADLAIIEAALSPWYRDVFGCFADGGAPVRLVEAGGSSEQLISLWLANGANGLLFAESAAGFDVRELRARFGRELAVIGNIDERALASSHRDISAQISSKVGLVGEGGYIPTPDRPVSGDVSFGDYVYYLETLKKA